MYRDMTHVVDSGPLERLVEAAYTVCTIIIQARKVAEILWIGAGRTLLDKAIVLQ